MIVFRKLSKQGAYLRWTSRVDDGVLVVAEGPSTVGGFTRRLSVAIPSPAGGYVRLPSDRECEAARDVTKGDWVEVPSNVEPLVRFFLANEVPAKAQEVKPC
jgi:hypothetical protein